MCHPPGARPPDVPADLLPISGGAAGEDVILTSEDATRFRAHLAKAGEGDSGVVIAPDVRGLHPFYEELAERFASAGVHAIALDYFGRTAGTTRRGDDFEFREHVAKAKTTTIQADVASAIGHLRGATDARRIFVLGFCMGGRQAFFASAEHAEVAGVIGFYGRLSTREGEEGTAPKDRAPRMRSPGCSDRRRRTDPAPARASVARGPSAQCLPRPRAPRMRAPVLGLFGGDDP